IVPYKDLTCLVAKASADECMLWHRRLGHLNFKTMNKLVRHNLVRGLPTKCFENDHTCTACLKGKQHKASCKSKVVNSVSKPLHTLHMDLFGPTSNGVAERRNRTLIEAARIMLADAKLPVTFWAEAVNTTCYVQNRVLVNNSQNKIPYELFNGRTPAIRFLKPFSCHVMILNTLDKLEKFKAKEDEGTKDAASQEVKKDVSSLRYIALLNWVHDALLESSSSKPQDDCSTNILESSGNYNPTSTSINPLADQLETLTVETPIPTVSLPVLTACFTDSPEPSSDARLISKRVANQVETPSLDNILTLANRFKDILGVTTTSDESNGVEADVSNMETTITTSPTPTLRIHKDHPKSQIIGHVDTPIQTGTSPKRGETHWDKMVLKNKKDERGIVIKNIARLVAQGHTQEERIDYDEVFAHVARIEAIRLFLAYASFIGFTVYQMDMKSAFLYGTINEEVYVMQPPGFQDPEFPAKVYKVEKAMGTIDQTLFIRRQKGDFILVQVYVDDIIFGSSNPQLCREFKALMHEKFQMSAMGELNFFLGLRILREKTELEKMYISISIDP
nr:putative ribonuclease H-like domain-containing protein [Tanacetum cinerariifolium]